MPVSFVDAFTRHQIYLEGYKAGLEARLDPVLEEMFSPVSRALESTRVDKLNELSRKSLRRLISRIRDLMETTNSAFLEDMLGELEAFSEAESNLQQDVFTVVFGQTITAAAVASTTAPLLGLAALKRNRAGYDRLWASVRGTPDPATGLTPVSLLKNYLNFLTGNVTQLVSQGYANGWTLKETLNAIFGTKSRRFKDGFTARARRNGTATIHTLIQHVSSRIQAAVASVFFDKYEWVAVLDKGTTDICRFRDGKTYRYGKGPLPPAHYRCRSRAVPVSKGQATGVAADTFYTWIDVQPKVVQNDILGPKLARDLRNGRLSATKLGKFRARRQLTRPQLAGKFPLITKS